VAPLTARPRHDASQRVLANLRMRHFRRNPEGYRVAGRWVPTEDFELLAI
jgi:RimJ/RimL family protein N-acetyltransferase